MFGSTQDMAFSQVLEQITRRAPEAIEPELLAQFNQHAKVIGKLNPLAFQRNFDT